WVIQSSDNSRLEIGACLDMKNIGKPCAGKLHARFDEGGQARDCSLLYPQFLTPQFWRQQSLLSYQRPTYEKKATGNCL
ncbi:MAG: hypothetical protein Q8K74_11060, partial [Candidatus Nitrotoga sp.]|nr:hypothetical protein [Candidatus Nitrotoga sp.]MDP1856558.1 hypothetical protein [Candidatus Nitrotoga sp.]